MARARAAVIGLGRITSTFDEELGAYGGLVPPHGHIACYRAVPEVEVVGMADLWAEQREAARQKWSFDALYEDYRQMLRATKPAIVSVGTSAKPRADILLEIANGGYGVKAIWAEKPITHALEQADRVIEACRRAGIVLAVNCTRRWLDTFRHARAMVRDGIIGDVVHVQALSHSRLSHNGSHLITALTMFVPDRAEWVVGEVASDAAAASDEDCEGAGYIGFPHGVRGYYRTLNNGPNDQSYDITGTAGMIRLMDDGEIAELWTREAPIAGQKGQQPVRRSFPQPRGRRSAGVNVVYDLLRCIETGDPPLCSGEDAREALEIAIATRESHRRGRVRVDLPLPDRQLQIVSYEDMRFNIPRGILRKRGVAGA